MKSIINPALAAFVSEIKTDLIIAQVLICRCDAGFALRHIHDAENAGENLQRINKDEIRALAQFTASGAFRPLKSAPNLREGWVLKVSSDEELEFAINQIYPGAIADWFAVQCGKPPVTNYREFTNRQTGMYRITAMLTDAQAAPVIRACCHKNFCLKQRLWTVNSLTTDAREEKSLIPCLEPCAILLEFARKAMRLEQAAERGETTKESATTEISEIREADFENPNNPRRVQLEIEKRNQSAKKEL